ncbi:MAG: SAM-dependent DNA methyltransferase [Verrucomicrobia bacterium]|nr:SAM-dependent DNA methyltransferase [Verrucomicrobiota bacterium]
MAKAKAPYKQPNGTGGLRELFRELWNTAVTLRGNIEPADYKRYVLPLIFLRFLSLRYEVRRAEIDKEIADPESDLHTTSEQMALQLREDPDLYLAKQVFLVPEDARWDNIIKIARADDVKIRLDKILELLETTFPKLKGLLPSIYAGSNLDKENIAGLINLFSKDIFRFDIGGIDMLGRVYEYFIGEFASSEGKRGGEYFTPESIVKTLVAMLEPTEGKVYDPCCGSGGMFVQSDHFAHHSGKLSFFGQEAKDFTYRLCRLNLFIHGLDGDIKLGSSYGNDQHASLKADYIIANPPFNDGSKGDKGWGADKITQEDPRRRLPGNPEPLPLAPRNANTMWMLHFMSHLKDPSSREPGGSAGFVMARGELSNAEIARLSVRRALVEGDFIDCVVTLTGKLFANTQIPCALVFLSKNRVGGHGFRRRLGETLFISGDRLATLIPGSRRQKQLAAGEIERIATVYREFKRERRPEPIQGFSAVADLAQIRTFRYALTPGRYVGATDDIEDEEPFEERFPKLKSEVLKHLSTGGLMDLRVRAALADLITEE